MASEENITIQIFEIITKFLSDNIIYFLILTLLIICRKAISDLIRRLTNLKLKKGDSELGIEATAPIPKTKTTILEKAAEPSIETNEDKEETIKKEEVQEHDWSSKMHTAFDEGRIDDAKEAFNNYALTEQDPVKLQKNKNFFLYFLFTKGNDNSAIEQLKNLVNNSTDEESKFTSLIWLSFCLNDSSQTDKEIELWETSINSFRLENIIIKASVKLAYALDRKGNTDEAKGLLISKLKSISISGAKAKIYSALSQIEMSLGNKRLAIYCKDKSLELDPNNRDELFNAAYQASKEDVNDLSISNYINLLRIDAKNTTALNNLGVHAQDANLKVKAVEKYKESSSFNNSLSMSNQGYLLVNAGFLAEAEVIAKKALELEDPHGNIYKLLTKIRDLQKEQDTKWNELIDKSIERQKFIRNYTYSYYEGNVNKFDGDWATENNNITTIKMEGDKLEATWQESGGIFSSEKYNVTLTGKVNNSAFLGQYEKKKDNGKLHGRGLLSNIDNTYKCIGILSTDESVITFISENDKENFSLALKRKSLHKTSVNL